MQCVARAVRSKLFSLEVDNKAISGVFFLRRYFVSSIFRNVVFFAHTYSLKTARLATTTLGVWVPCAGTDLFEVHYHQCLDALRAVCGCHACMCRV